MAVLEGLDEQLKRIEESQSVLERDMREIGYRNDMTSISLQKMSRDQAIIEKNQNRLDTRMSSLEDNSEVSRKSQLHVEQVQYPRILAALDGIIAGIEKFEQQDKRLSRIEDTADNLTLRVSALERSANK